MFLDSTISWFIRISAWFVCFYFFTPFLILSPVYPLPAHVHTHIGCTVFHNTLYSVILQASSEFCIFIYDRRVSLSTPSLLTIYPLGTILFLIIFSSVRYTYYASLETSSHPLPNHLSSSYPLYIYNISLIVIHIFIYIYILSFCIHFLFIPFLLSSFLFLSF